MSHFQFRQIDVIRPPYKERFAVPRQFGLAKSTNSELHLLVPYNQADAVRGLEALSRLWMVFISHQTTEGGWCPTVRPPCFGGNTRMGVFATCSMFHPNPVGMSLVELRDIRCHKEHVILELGGLDPADDTLVVDVKSYLSFAESLPDARTSYTQGAPQVSVDVMFSEDLAERLSKFEQRYPYLCRSIVEVLVQDPRPVYHKGEEEGKTYAAWLLDFNVRWHVTPSGFEVSALEACQFTSRTLLMSLSRW